MKVLLVGRSNTYKSYTLSKLVGTIGPKYRVDSIFANAHGPTLGAEVYPLGGGKHRGLGKDYYKGASIAFIFGDGDEYADEVLSVEPNCVIHRVEGKEAYMDILEILDW